MEISSVNLLYGPLLWLVRHSGIHDSFNFQALGVYDCVSALKKENGLSYQHQTSLGMH